MNIIQFETISKNGIVKIPEAFKNFNDSRIKVILVKEESTKTADEIEDFNRLRELAGQSGISIGNNINIDRMANEVNSDIF